MPTKTSSQAYDTGEPATPTALFFHGLNTFNDDLLHLGPVNLGRMDRHIRRAIEARGIRFHSIDGIGFGSPESQARHACNQIATGFNLAPGSSVQLLGNSMGGLVTRALAHLWRTEPETNPLNLKIGKLISWGTPHAGSVSAEMFFTKNDATFRHYSRNALEEFNRRYPLAAHAPEYYFLCAATLRDVSPWFWGLYGVVHGLNPRRFQSSDGFIPATSQEWGQCKGTFVLDHFGQAGFAEILPLPSQRKRSREQFEKLCDAMAELIKAV